MANGLSYAQVAAQPPLAERDNFQHSETEDINENLQADIITSDLEQNSGASQGHSKAGEGRGSENYGATLRQRDIKTDELRGDDARSDSDADEKDKGKDKNKDRSHHRTTRGLGDDKGSKALALALHVTVGVVVTGAVAAWVWKSGAEGTGSGVEVARRVDKIRLAVGLTGLSLLFGGQCFAYRKLSKD